MTRKEMAPSKLVDWYTCSFVFTDVNLLENCACSILPLQQRSSLAQPVTSCWNTLLAPCGSNSIILGCNEWTFYGPHSLELNCIWMLETEKELSVGLVLQQTKCSLDMETILVFTIGSIVFSRHKLLEIAVIVEGNNNNFALVSAAVDGR